MNANFIRKKYQKTIKIKKFDLSFFWFKKQKQKKIKHISTPEADGNRHLHCIRSIQVTKSCECIKQLESAEVPLCAKISYNFQQNYKIRFVMFRCAAVTQRQNDGRKTRAWLFADENAQSCD